MKDEAIVIAGKRYLSAKRAAKLAKYTPDYVGQLARAGKIQSRMINKTRFVEEDSFREYLMEIGREAADLTEAQMKDDEVVIAGERYLSTKKIAKLAKYTPDYVGQLARSGKMESTMIGKTRFVKADSFRNYLTEIGRNTDALDVVQHLAPTQDFVKPKKVSQSKEVHDTTTEEQQKPKFFSDSRDAFPTVSAKESADEPVFDSEDKQEDDEKESLETNAFFGQKFATGVLALGMLFALVSTFQTDRVRAQIAEFQNAVNAVVATVQASGSTIVTTVGGFGERGTLSINQFDQRALPAGLFSTVGRDAALFVYCTLSGLYVGDGQCARVSDEIPNESPNLVEARKRLLAENEQEPEEDEQPVRVVERVVERVRTPELITSGVSVEELEIRLQELSNEMRRLIAESSTSTREVIVQRHIQPVERTVALTQIIDQLSDVDITNPTITGGTISDMISIETNKLTVGNLIANSLTTTGGITSYTSVTAPIFIATSTTATSTFAGGFDVSDGGFVYDWQTENVGIATSSPSATLTVNGTTYFSNATSGLSFRVDDQLGDVTPFVIDASGNVGIGTTSPVYKLDVWGNFAVGTSSTPAFFVDTSTGNVGIGTTSPFTQFSVTGTGSFSENLLVEGDASVDGSITFGTSTDETATFNARIGSSLVPTADNTFNIGTTSPWLSWRSGFFGTSVSIGGTATTTGTDLTSSGSFTIDTGDTLSINTDNNQDVTFGTGLLSFLRASSTRQSIFDTLYVGSTATSTLTSDTLAFPGSATIDGSNGTLTVEAGDFDVNASGAVTVNGSTITLADPTVLSDTLDVTGLATFAAGFISQASSTVASDFTVTGDTIFGDATSDILTVNARVASDLIPDQNATRDFGSPSFYWDDAFVDTLTANSISAASTTISGTQSETFAINTDNATADDEDATLIFYRGTVVPNALLTWDSTQERFDFNQPLYIQNDSSTTTVPTFELAGSTGQSADVLHVASSSDADLFSVTSAGTVGVSSSSPAATFSVTGDAWITGQTLLGTDGSNVGIGTTSPFAKLSVSGDGYFDGDLTVNSLTSTTSISAPFFTATDASATSTFAGGLNVESGGLVYDFSSGNTTLGGTLSVTGATTLSDTLSVTNLATFQSGFLSQASSTVGDGTQSGGLTISGGATTTGDQLVQGNTTLSGLLDLTGAATFSSTLTVGGNLLPDTDSAYDIGADATRFANIFTDSFDSTNFTLSGAGTDMILSTDSSGGVVATSTPTLSHLFATSTTATSTFAGGVNIGNGNFFVDFSSGNTTIDNLLTVSGTGTSTIEDNLEVLGGLQVGNSSLYLDTDSIENLSGALALQPTGGSVGIGTTSPESLLDVAGDLTLTGGTQYWTLTDTGDNLNIRSSQNFGLVLSDNGTNFNVGIGTAPSATLHVSDAAAGVSLRLENARTNGKTWDIVSNDDGELAFRDSDIGETRIALTPEGSTGIGDSTPDAFVDISSSTASTLFRVDDSGDGDTSPFVIDGDGNVGVGTTSPSSELEVADGTDSSIRINPAGSDAVLGFDRLGSAVWQIWNDNNAPGPQTNLLRITGDGGLTDDKLVINQDGNVGIGTSSPVSRLSVKTTGTQLTLAYNDSNYSDVYTNSDGRLNLDSSGNRILLGDGTFFLREDSASSNLHSLILNRSAGAGVNPDLAGPSGTPGLVLGADDSESSHLVLDDGGNVGIGTSDPQNRLDISGATVIGANYAGVETAPTNGLLVEGSTGIGTTSPATDFSVSGDGYFTGGLGVGVATTVPGVLQTSGDVSVGGELTVAGTGISIFTEGRLHITGAPDGTNINEGSVYVNPPSAGVNNVLAGFAVDGTEKVRIDAEGDVQATGLFNSTNAAGTNEFAGSLSIGEDTTLGDGTDDTVVFNARINSSFVPATDDSYDLGSETFRWSNIYASTTTIDNLVAGGTASSTFIINEGNTTADTENAALAFERGSISPNATLTWNATDDRFEFNNFEVQVANVLTVAGSASSSFAGPLWLTGSPEGTGLADATLYINPPGAAADESLFSIGVAGTERFAVDAEGDTTIQASLGVENQLFDITQDVLTIDDSVKITGEEIIDSTDTTRIEIGSTNTITGNLTTTGTFTADGAGPHYFSSGNVGIGTTTPGAKLDVQGGAQFGTSNIDLIDSAGKIAGLSTTYFNTDTSANLAGIITDETGTGALVFADSPSLTDLTVTSGGIDVTGNSTITGTLSSLTGLSSSGTITFSGISDGVVQAIGGTLSATSSISGSFIEDVFLRNDGDDTTTGQLTAANFVASDASATSTFAGGLNVESGGLVYDFSTNNVGIGTESPSSPLDISGGSLTLDNNTFVRWRDSGGTARTILSFDSNDDLIIGRSSAMDALRLYAGGTTERMTILGNGNVGIGTTSPQSRTHITNGFSGQVSPHGDGDELIVENSGDAGISILSPDANNGTLVFGTPSDSLGASIFWNHDSDILDVGTRNTSGELRFETGNSVEAVRIDSSGSVGIGTTTPDRELHIEGAGNVFAKINASTGNNAALELGETGGLWSLLNEGTSANEFKIRNSGGTRLTILDGGNVGIGTTSPYARLSVEGTAGAGNTGLAIKAGGGADDLALIGNNGNTYALFRETDTDDPGRLELLQGGSTKINLQTDGDVYFNNSGNVGIGETIPSAKLEIATPASGGAFIANLKDNTVDGFIVQQGSNEYINIDTTNSSEAITIGNTTTNPETHILGGNVGIGTTDPSTKLDVQGTASSSDAVIDNTLQLLGITSGTLFSDSSGNVTASSSLAASNIEDVFLRNDQDDTTTGTLTANSFELGDDDYIGIGAALERIVFDSTGDDIEILGGNVGIGTDSPDRKLEVEFSSATTLSGLSDLNSAEGLQIQNEQSQDNSVAALHLSAEGSGGGQTWSGIIAEALSQSASKLHFYTESSDARSIGMTLNNDGNVGIGTTTPGTTLDVTGGRIRAANGSAPNEYVELFDDGSTARLESSVNPIFIDSVTDLRLHANMSASGDIYLDANDFIKFRNAGSDVMTIDDGKVGIGTTSPGFVGNGKVLTIDSSDISRLELSRSSDSLSDGTTVGTLDFFAGTASNRIAFITGQVSGTSENSGELAFSTANAGSFGDPKLFIDKDGNIGIGTTSPSMLLSVAETGQNQAIFGQGRSSGDTSIYVGNSNASNDSGAITFDNDNNKLVFYVGGDRSSNPLVVEDGGNVGIGVADPAAALHLEDTTNNIARFFRTSQVSTEAQVYVGTAASSNNALSVGFHSDSAGASTNYGYLTLYGDSASDGLVVSDTGSIGIGTTEPLEKLHVTDTNDGTITTGLYLKNATGVNGGVAIDFDNTISDNVQARINSVRTSDANFSTDLAFHTNNTSGTLQERLRIDTNGNVGIGTTGPGDRLHVLDATADQVALVESGDNTANIEIKDNADSAYLGVQGSTNIAWFGASNLPGTDTINLDTTNGNVGIGTENPSVALDVSKDDGSNYVARFSNEQGAAGHGLQVRSAGGGDGSFLLDLVRDYDSADESVLRVLADGNVGIGTTDPQALLNVGHGTASHGINQNPGGTSDKYILTASDTALETVSYNLAIDEGSRRPRVKFFLTDGASSSGAWGLWQSWGTAGQQPFVIGSASSEWLRIDTSGNVGIGTTSPSGNLHINDTGNASFTIDRGNTNNGADINFITDGNTNQQDFIISNRDSGALESGQNARLDILEKAGGSLSELVSIEQSGNVGIGTTSPSKKLHIHDESGNSSIEISTNAADGDAFIDFTDNGARTWVVGNNAGQGDDLIFDRSSINGSDLVVDGVTGNVGIGATGPGQKLTVSGARGLPATSGTTQNGMFRITPDTADGGTASLDIGITGGDTWIQATSRADLSVNNDLLLNPNGGNVGIGTTGPADELDIVGTSPHLAIFDDTGATDRFSLAAIDDTLRVSVDDNNDGSWNRDVITFEDGGNVGIGTTSPSNRLEIYNTSGNDPRLIVSNDNGNLAQLGDIGSNNDGFLRLLDSTETETIRIRADGDTFLDGGDVGVGTDSPTSKLDVEIAARATTFNATDSTTWGDVQIRNPQDTLNAATGIGFIVDGTSDTVSAGIAAVKAHATNEAADLAFITRAIGGNPTERMRIDSSGNIGIGTTSPAAKLDIQSDDPSDIDFFTLRDSNGFQVLKIADNGNSALIEGSLNTNFIFKSLGNADTEGFRFRDSDDNDLVAINENGNVGIGTTSPDSKFHVGGSFNVQKTFAQFSPSDFTIGGTSSGKGLLWNGTVDFTGGTSNYSHVQIEGNVTTQGSTQTINEISGLQVNEPNITVGSGDTVTDAVTLKIDSAPTEGTNNYYQLVGTDTFAITQSGNIGIGTTSPSRELEVTGPGNVHSRITTSGGNDAVLELNEDGTVWSILNEGSSTNELKFRNAGGTRLTILDGGNVGIGTTSPFAKLSVSGDGYFDGDLTVNSLTSTTSISAPFFTATDASATSTFAGGLNVDSGGLVYDFSTNNVGIGTASPGAKLEIGSGQIFVPAGVVGAPSYSFTGDSDTGIYRSGTNEMAISAGGVDAIRFTAGKVLPTSAGSETSPTFARYFDNNTGIWWPSGGDRLAVSTGGVERLRVDDTGNVGIGTTTPGTTLDVTGGRIRAANGSAPNEYVELFDDGSTARLESSVNPIFIDSVTDLRLHANTSASGDIYLDANDFIKFRNAGSDVMTIDDGNVGIGTTSPNSILHINSDSVTSSTLLTLESDIDNAEEYNEILFKRSTGDNYGAIRNYISDSGDSQLRFAVTTDTGATLDEVLTLDADGNVGIGESDPSELLEVSGGNILITQANTVGALFTERTGDVTQRWRTGGISSSGHVSIKDETNNTFPFQIESGTPTSSFIIQSDGDGIFDAGNVGIGTMSPAGMLTVESDNNLDILFQGRNKPVSIQLSTNGNSGSFSGAEILANRTNSPTAGATELIFGTSNDTNAPIERMRIDGNGNVGIGTTSPDELLQITGTSNPSIKIYEDSAGSGQIGSLHLYSQNSNGDLMQYSEIRATKTPTAGAEDGQIEILTTKDGVLNRNFIFTEDGELGVGITDPNDVLDVQANSAKEGIRITGVNTTNNGAQGAIQFSDSSNSPVARIIGYRGDSFDDGDIAFEVKEGGSWGESVRIDQSGNVGVGTTSPAHKLTVDEGRIEVQKDSNPFVQLTQGSDKAYFQLIGGSARLDLNSPGEISFSPAGSRKVTIDSSGNIGIGTTTPSSLLHLNDVNNNDATQITFGFTSGGTTQSTHSIGRNSSTGLLEFDAKTNNNGFLFDSSAGASHGDFVITDMNVGIGTTTPWGKLSVTNTGSGPSFIVEDSAFPDSTPFIIDASGNVGIGTASPDEPLEVKRDVNTNNVLLAIGNDVGTSQTRDSWMKFYASAGTTDHTWTIGAYGGSASDRGLVFSRLGDRDTNPHDGVVQMIINQDGNVGIGTTSPSVLLEVSDTAANATPEIRITNDAQSFDLQVVGSRGDNFEITQSNNIPFAIEPGTPSNTLYLDTSGNVGIGTAAPEEILSIELPDSNNEGIHMYDESGDEIASLQSEGSVTGSRWASLKLNDGSQTNKVRLNANADNFINGGNVGIGTTSPSDLLSVEGDVSFSEGSNYRSFYWNAGTGRLGLGERATDAATTLHVFEQDAVGDLVTFEQDSNAGVQTWLNLEERTGSGNSGIALDFTQAGTLASRIHSLRNGTTQGYNLIFSTTPDGGSLTEGARLDEDGNFGIGTTGPGSKLHLSGFNANDRIRLEDTDTTLPDDTLLGGLDWYTNDAGGGAGVAASVEAIANGGTGAADLQFLTGSPGSAGVKMTILQGGNVGIGTDSPSSNLNIYNDAASATANEEIVRIIADYTGGATTNDQFGGYLNFYHRTGGNLLEESARIGIIGRGNNAADLVFSTKNGAGNSATEKMRITRFGNVGIGQTSPDLSLEVGDVGTLTVDASDGVGIAGDIEVDDFARLGALRVGSTGTDPGEGNAYIEGTLTVSHLSGDQGTGSGTVGWNRVAQATAASGRIGGIVILTDNGGSGSPFQQVYRVSKDWTTNISLSLMHSTGKSYVDEVRAVYDSGAGEFYVDVNLDTSGNDPKVTVIKDADIGGTFEAVDFTSASLSGGETVVTLGLENNDPILAASSDLSDNIMNFGRAGNVGIGTANPSSKLEVFTTTGTDASITIEADDNTDDSYLKIDKGFTQTYNIGQIGSAPGGRDFQITENNGGATWRFTDDGRFILEDGELTVFGTGDSSFVGNVGIGTTSPAATLGVDGLAYIGGTGTSTIEDNLEVLGALQVGNSSLYLDTDSIENLSGDLLLQPTGGNVGIGTTTPDKNLEVIGTGAVVARVASSDQTSASLQLCSRLSNCDFGTALSFTETGNIFRIDNNGAVNSEIAFNTRPSAGGSVERLRIDPDGNVGIGTDSPDRLLELEGSDARIHVDSSSHAVLNLDRNGTNSASIVQFNTAGAGSGFEIGLDNDGSSDFYIGDFGMSNKWLTVTGSGDVGIGTTNPLANFSGGSTTTKFAINGGSPSGYTEVAHFAAGGDSNNTGAIVRIGQVSNDRGLYIKAGRGLSDQAKALFGLRNSGGTDQDVLTLQQGGNVGIGETSPTASLDIAHPGDGNPVLQLQGSADNLVISSTGSDFSIFNDQQNNGITIYDGTGAVRIEYSDTDVAVFDGSGVDITTGGLLVSGNSVITSGRVAQNLTGLSSSGTITFSGLSANRLVATDGSSNLTNSISEANLESSISGVTDIFTNNDTIADANVANDLTISASGSVADGALSANVSLLGQTISSSEIESSVSQAQSATNVNGGNIDTLSTNGWYEWGSTNPTGAPASWLAMLQADHNQKIQIAFGGSGFGKLFIRRADNGTFYDWTEFWSEENDGAGSGLNADLLDGEEGSFYQNASNINAGTLSDSRLSSNVSLLGQSISTGETDFADQNLRTSDSPTFSGLSLNNSQLTGVQSIVLDNTERSTHTVTNGLLMFDQAGDNNLNIYNSNLGTWVKIWDDSNDGAGSGLNADLLDGNEASAFSQLGSSIEKGELANSGTLSFDWSDAEVANNITVSSTGSVDSTALTDGGTISFDWVDAEVADNLTISASGSVADGALSANVSLLGQTISSSEIVDDTIVEADLNAIDSASNGECLTYNSGGSNFEWEACDQSGTVNSGTSGELAYYASSGDTVSGASGLTYEENTTGGLWDVANATFTHGTTTVVALGTDQRSYIPADVDFKSDDGTEAYYLATTTFIGVESGIRVQSLSTPWDISTASNVASTTEYLDLSGQETAATGIFFGDSGSKVYVSGVSGSGGLHEYDLSTPYNLNSASFNQSVSPSFDDQPQDIFWSPDGLNAFFLGAETNEVYTLNVSTAWSLSGVISQSFSVNSQEPNPTSLFFRDDGTEMYIIGETDDIHIYELSTPWDIDTASFSGQFSPTQSIAYVGLFIRPNGEQMYTTDANTGTFGTFVEEYDVDTLQTNSLFGIEGNPSHTLTVGSDDGGSFCVDDDGTSCASAGTTDGDIYYNAAHAGYSDVAEKYPSREDLRPGTIVSIDREQIEGDGSGNEYPNPYVKTARRTDRAIVGAISTNPGLTLGSDYDRNEGDYSVGLSGRIPVRVNLDGGEIAPGDRITISSTTPGVGMKATNPNQSTIGYALSGYAGSGNELKFEGEGRVMVFIDLSAGRISEYIEGETIELDGEGESAYWQMDPSGKIVYLSPVDLNGFPIRNVEAITSESGKWTIDKNGILAVQEVQTKKLCVGDTCVDEEGLKKLLERAGLASVGSPSHLTDTVNNTDTTTSDTSTTTDSTIDTATTTDDGTTTKNSTTTEETTDTTESDTTSEDTSDTTTDTSTTTTDTSTSTTTTDTTTSDTSTTTDTGSTTDTATTTDDGTTTEEESTTTEETTDTSTDTTSSTEETTTSDSTTEDSTTTEETTTEETTDTSTDDSGTTEEDTTTETTDTETTEGSTE